MWLVGVAGATHLAAYMSVPPAGGKRSTAEEKRPIGGSSVDKMAAAAPGAAATKQHGSASASRERLRSRSRDQMPGQATASEVHANPPSDATTEAPKAESSDDWMCLADLTAMLNALGETATRSLSSRVDTASETFLGDLLAGMYDALQSAQSDVLAAKVPFASYGRIKDAFEKLKSAFHDQLHELVRVELNEIHQLGSGELRQQQASMEEYFQQHFQSSIARFMEDRDSRLAAAQSRELEAKHEAARIFARSTGSEALIQKAEDQLRLSEDKESKATAKLEKLEAMIKYDQEEWERHMGAAMAKCTLKPRREGPQHLQGSLHWKRQQRSAGEQMMAHCASMNDSHGAQMAYLLGMYEDSKQRVSDSRKEEREEAAAQLAEKAELLETAREELRAGKAALEAALEEQRKVTAAEEEKVSQLKANASTIHRVAREVALVEYKKLEERMAAVEREREEANQRVSAKADEVHVAASGHRALEEKVRALEEQRQKDRATSQAQLAACVTALNAARAAAKNGAAARFHIRDPMLRICEPCLAVLAALSLALTSSNLTWLWWLRWVLLCCSACSTSRV